MRRSGLSGGRIDADGDDIDCAMSERIKGDERILGDGSVVEEVLKVCQGRPDGLFAVAG
jgi:hypothetical protein